jgi:hypothetical protein
MKIFLTLLLTLSFGFGSFAQDIDYYGPQPFGEVLKRSFDKTWTPTAISAIENRKYMILLDAAKANAVTFSSDADISTLSMTPIANLYASGATYGSMLRSIFQMVDLNAPLDNSANALSGSYQLNSFIHSYYALDANDNNAAILSDRGTYYIAATDNTGYLGLTFSTNTSAVTITASSKYEYNASTSSFTDLTSWTDKYLKINGTSLEWTSTSSDASAFFLADPNDLIDLEIEAGSDFNPASTSYQPNAWAAFPESINPTSTGFSDLSKDLDDAYHAQLDATTAAATAASSILDEIETTLTNAGAELRYPKAFYLALRENMLSHTIASTDVYGATLGDRTNKYVYFTNATDDNGVPHPFLVTASFAASTRPNQLIDVSRPPGDGAGGGYEEQSVTRTTKGASYLMKVPLKNYGLIETLLDNDLSTYGDLGEDAGATTQTVYNYASLSSNGVAVDGVPMYPSLNNTLLHASNAAEITHGGIHVGRGLELHYHADGHSYSKNGINLYNLADYEGRNHPPLIGMAYDGVALFGRYEENYGTMEGYSIALDEYGGHDHGDDFGFHYHAHTQEVSSTGNNAVTFDQRFLLVGAWKGKINDIPAFLEVKTNQLAPDATDARYAGASYDAVETNNSAPTISAATFSVADGAADGTLVGTITASDVDGDALTYSITNGNTGDAFALGSSDGKLTVATSAQVAYATNPSFSLTVQVSDGALSASATFTVSVLEGDDETTVTEITWTPNVLNTFVLATTATVTNGDGAGIDTYFRNSGVVVKDDSYFAVNGVHPANQNDYISYYPKSIIKASLASDELESRWPYYGVSNTANASKVNGVTIDHEIDMEGLTFGPDGGETFIYVGDEYNYIYQIELATGEIKKQWNLANIGISTPTDKGIEAITFNPANGYFYVGIQEDKEIHEVNLAIDDCVNPSTCTVTKINSFSVLNSPSGLFYDATEQALLVFCGTVTNGDQYLYAYTTAGELTYDITIPASVGISRGDGIFIANDKAYISDSQGPMWVSEGSMGANLFEVEWNGLASLNSDGTTNSAPTISAAAFSVADGAADGTLVGTVTASDSDGDALTYAIKSGNTGDAFLIGSSDGKLTVAKSTQVAYATNPTFTLSIEVSDGVLTASANITVNVTPDEEEVTLGLNEKINLFYPNPATDQINFNVNDVEHAVLYELSGKKIMSTKKANMDISRLDKGIYLLKIQEKSGQIFSSKIIKE